MKTRSYYSKLVARVLSGFAIFGLTAGAFAWAPVAAASTALPAPQATTRASQWAGIYSETQRVYIYQQLTINNARTIAGNTAAYVVAEKAFGRDTSALEAALATYNAQLDSAQADHDQAGAIMDAHAGFDQSGKVTDYAQAKDTLIGARNQIRWTHIILTTSTKTLYTSVLTFRSAYNNGSKPWLARKL